MAKHLWDNNWTAIAEVNMHYFLPYRTYTYIYPRMYATTCLKSMSSHTRPEKAGIGLNLCCVNTCTREFRTVPTSKVEEHLTLLVQI